MLIVAFDLQKASIINRLFYGPMTAGIPATLLRNHPNAYVLTTEKVANEAKVMDISQVIQKRYRGCEMGLRKIKEESNSTRFRWNYLQIV
ncbi:MAG: hypothetical protein ACLTAI_08140 [Thomasclavelia sp.]